MAVSPRRGETDGWMDGRRDGERKGFPNDGRRGKKNNQRTHLDNHDAIIASSPGEEMQWDHPRASLVPALLSSLHLLKLCFPRGSISALQVDGVEGHTI